MKRKPKLPTVSIEALEPRTLLTVAGIVNGAVPLIVNGELTSEYPAVGIVANRCTGTLISPTHVLTAGHCYFKNGEPLPLEKWTFEVGGKVYTAKNWTVHPDYDNSSPFQGHDLSIMELSEPVIGIDPLPLLRRRPVVGETLTLVGFGQTGTTINGSNFDFGNKSVATTRLDNISVIHIGWTLNNHTEGSTSFGDSGGPAFINGLIAGVTSGGSRETHKLGARSVDSRVDIDTEWIDSTLGNARNYEVFTEGNETVVLLHGEEVLRQPSSKFLILKGTDLNDIFDASRLTTPVAIYGGDGDDVIFSGSANDRLFGEAGNDRIYGNDGNDILNGGDGNDTLSGGKGDDTLLGYAGDDVMYGGNGNDRIHGDIGNDRAFGDNGFDRITGGQGDDFLRGGRGKDTINGNEGNDTLIGDHGIDRMFGNDGLDSIFGDDLDDIFFGL